VRRHLDVLERRVLHERALGEPEHPLDAVGQLAALVGVREPVLVAPGPEAQAAVGYRARLRSAVVPAPGESGLLNLPPAGDGATGTTPTDSVTGETVVPPRSEDRRMSRLVAASPFPSPDGVVG